MPFRSLGHQLQVFEFNSLTRLAGVRHFVSTRAGGGSLAPHRGLNLSFRVGDDPAQVLENRRCLFAAAGIPIEHVVACQQVHAAHVASVDLSARGRGASDFESGLPNTDAMVTATPGICLMMLAADCVPVLTFDPVAGVVGIAHAGWRGTVRGVAGALLARMHEEFGSDPAQVIAAIGPSIGPDDYEVGLEVIEAVREAFPTSWAHLVRESPDGKGFLDLWQANVLQLRAAGVRPEHIEVAGISTYHTTETFFSDRREGPGSGRFAACIELTS